MILEDILKVWPLILGICGLVVWIVRLESKCKYNEKGIDLLQNDKERLAKIEKDITAIKTYLELIKSIAEKFFASQFKKK